MQDRKLKSDIYNLPNLVSFIRILMAPILFILAFNQQPVWFLAVLIFSAFTDVLDGFLARYLNQITELGSHLDSWGDFVIYSTISICAWILWPEIVQQYQLYIITIIGCFTVPVFLGLLKFRALTSYHTWSVKIAVAITFIAYLLLFSGLLDWPIKVATVASLIAALEEISITLIIKHEHADVRSFFQALQYRRDNNSFK